ncbi:cbb3-type cytochrome oxidase assembly protein CcoS [Dokdonia sp. PRO95]|uniref:cbb3-type cytochrome oxidase assembly protein CcoS n=1 Tax=unclassified Dokdonia TaxID=2615033 RepID=UPI00054EB636|nr:cbb3-type cytochrome oxidase assembly protein CcoS [Dokdonia sp. PRO95]
MSIIYMLLAISVVVALVFFCAFVISVQKGQYDDTYTPSVRMLFDDELVKDKSTDTTPEPTEKSIQIKE